MSSDPQSIVAAMSRIAEQSDLREGELEARLDEIVDTAGAIFAVAGAGVMLFGDDANLSLIGATNDTGRALERAQQETGEGPGLEACRSGRMVRTVNLADDPRWPTLAEVVIPMGVASVLSAPIWVRDQAVGNLNLFDADAREWSETEQAGLTAFAGAAGAMIRIAIEADHRGRVVAQLQHLLTSGDLPRREASS